MSSDIGFNRCDGFVGSVPQNFINANLPVCPLCGSPDPFWKLKDKMELTAHRILFRCSRCGGILSATQGDFSGTTKSTAYTVLTTAGAVDALVKKSQGKDIKTVYMKVEDVGDFRIGSDLLGKELPIDEFKAMAASFSNQQQYAPAPQGAPQDDSDLTCKFSVTYGAAPQYAPAPEFQQAPQYAPAPEFQQAPQYAPAPEFRQAPQYAPAPGYQQAPQYAPAPQPQSEKSGFAKFFGNLVKDKKTFIPLVLCASALFLCFIWFFIDLASSIRGVNYGYYHFGNLLLGLFTSSIEFMAIAAVGAGILLKKKWSMLTGIGSLALALLQFISVINVIAERFYYYSAFAVVLLVLLRLTLTAAYVYVGLSYIIKGSFFQNKLIKMIAIIAVAGVNTLIFLFFGFTLSAVFGWYAIAVLTAAAIFFFDKLSEAN